MKVFINILPKNVFPKIEPIHHKSTLSLHVNKTSSLEATLSRESGGGPLPHSKIKSPGTSGKFVILKFTNFRHFFTMLENDHVGQCFEHKYRKSVILYSSYSDNTHLGQTLVVVEPFLGWLSTIGRDISLYPDKKNSVTRKLMSFNRNSINFV